MKNLFDIKGKVIVITGGCGILGKNIANYLAEQGAKIVILDRVEDLGKQLEAELNQKTEALFLTTDVLNKEVLEENKKAIVERFGTIDILLNAAGGNMAGATIAPDKTFLDLDIDAFRKVVDLNLFGTILPTTVFVPVMAQNKKGAIVNFCSESALRPLTRVVGYGAAKSAIASYTRYMATELATKFSPELRVNAIVPGFLLTNQNRALLTNPDGSYTDGNIWTVIALTQFDVYDIEVRNCVFWADKAHNMVVGPESRGIPFSGIRFHDNIVLENRQDDSVYPGTMAVMIADNGTFSDITFENIIVEDINGGKVICVHFANAWAFDSLYGQWAKDITFRNISYTGTRATRSWIRGLNGTQSIDGLTVDGFTVNGQTVTGKDGPYLEINGYVRNVTIQ